MTTQQLGNLNNEQIKMKTAEYQGIQAEVQKTPFRYPLHRLAELLHASVSIYSNTKLCVKDN